MSRLALMIASDPVVTLRELQRVTVAGGHIVTALWAPVDANPRFALPGPDSEWRPKIGSPRTSPSAMSTLPVELSTGGSTDGYGPSGRGWRSASDQARSSLMLWALILEWRSDCPGSALPPGALSCS